METTKPVRGYIPLEPLADADPGGTAVTELEIELYFENVTR